MGAVMMNGKNRRRLDAARAALVGVVPDPKGQVEQITTALIYKFLDELDQKAVQAGDSRAFFTGKYAKFTWQKLLSPEIDGDRRLALYREAVETMADNSKLSDIFRAMLRGADPPFQNARVLSLFLKEIDGLECGHTEDLGDAYEHLLSIMGTQGNAGQFRTPRHIIDFIVKVVNPQKGERILDPACGTAGFLVSAYNHIMAANTETKPGDKLTTAEKRKLPGNISGRDIDPGMTRLAAVNLYLHGVKQPQIMNYDTLSDDALWHERHDVILANPPFMTPRGGIQPHDKFAVRANRAEVLFVDYIAEHLLPSGRAGVIVPEGVVFQLGRAYKELRKLLVEEWGLFAVVSLPAGVFNPYSGVKTSILFLDKTRRADSHVLFVKINSDGFDLGANRAPVAENDLPEAEKTIRAWQGKGAVKNAITAVKKEIAEEDYMLVVDKYATESVKSIYPVVKIKDICDIVPGQKVGAGEPGYLEIGDICLADKSYDISQKQKRTVAGAVRVPAGTLLVSTVRPTRGAITLTKTEINVSNAFCRLKCPNHYVFYMLMDRKFYKFLETRQRGATYPTCKNGDILDYSIPLPPIEIQRKIIAEIGGYEKKRKDALAVAEKMEEEIVAKIGEVWGK